MMVVVEVVVMMMLVVGGGWIEGCATQHRQPNYHNNINNFLKKS